MVNPNPSPLTRFQNGQPRPLGAGRKPGQVGLSAQITNEAAKEAAERLGFIREVETVGADGKSKVQLHYEGEDGIVGYMMWLGLHHPASFAAILGRTQTREINAKVERRLGVDADVRYRTVAEVEADLRRVGYSDEKIQFLIEDLRPQNKVSMVNAEPKTPMKTLAGANGGTGPGDYLDEDGTLRNVKDEPTALTEDLRR